MYGRHGESPIPIVASYTPAQCFEAAIEAARIAITYRTPVILLTDTFLANSSEPWRIPDVDSLPPIDPAFALPPENGAAFRPYDRDARLARPWAIPGTAGLEHRIGGLEKQDGTGNISYDPHNHELMTQLRAMKVQRVAGDLPPLVVDDPDGAAEVLVVGWGSTYGAINGAARRVRARGESVATLHLTHLNPLPSDLGEVLARYRRVVVPELNSGQLVRLLRAEYLVPAEGVSKVQGLPFTVTEVEHAIEVRL